MSRGDEDGLRKFQRLLRLLSYLSRPGGCTVKRLAELTGMNARSVYRDINELKDACFDIIQEEERRGSPFRLNPAQSTLGQTLTLEEVLSLALGTFLLEDHLGGIGRDAMRKLQHFIKGDKLIKVRDFPDSLAAETTDISPWMPQVMQAVSERRSLRIGYAKGDTKIRVVDPYTLFYQEQRWYIQAWDHLSQELRRFRLIRIRSLELLGQTFQIPDAYRSESALFHKWDLNGCDPIGVHCRVTPALAGWLQENPVHPTQVLTEGELRMEVRDLDALAGWLVGLTGLEVLRPPSLRFLVRQKALAVARANEATDSGATGE